jgi:transcriptional regulator with XRE-family HTH domain
VKYSKATRLVRAARGLSQTQLAKLVKCSVASISMIESGDRSPSVGMVERLAKALDVPFDLFTVLAADSAEIAGMPAKDAEYLGRRLLRLLTVG